MGRSRFFPLLGTLLLGCAGCSSLGPNTYLQPELGLLLIDDFYGVWTEPGILAVRGQLADTSLRLAATDRISVEVTVSSGDAETLLLEHPFCGYRSCTLVSVSMRNGHTVDELAPLLPQIGGRWWLVQQGRGSGAIRLFDSRRVDEAIQTLRRHPRVAEADRGQFDVPLIDPPPPLWIELLAAAPLDREAPRFGDGVVQGLRGDTVVVEYRQPNGSLRRHSTTIR